MAWSERLVNRDGVRLVCRDWGGSGQPVVLLHGLAGHVGEWDQVAWALSPRYRVVTFDQRGHGASERHPRDLSRAAYLADAIAVLDELALRRPVLVGQSLGGHTAMLAAAAYPTRVRALVLIEAGPGGPSPNAPADIGTWLDSWRAGFPSRDTAIRFFGSGAVGEGWAAGLEEREGRWWPRFDREVMVRSLADTARRSYWPEWSRVTCPTLIVLAQSGIIPARDVEQMLRRRHTTVAVSIPRTGHDLHLEQPESLHAILSSFLEELA